MFIVPVEIKQSLIEGKGVFAKAYIPEGTIVWQYKDGHDKKMTKEEFAALDDEKRKVLERVAYLSDTSGMWVMPPYGDPACFTNHSPKANLKIVYNPAISDEPLFVASDDIQAGEEITDNYLEFDENSKPYKHEWLA